jgi:hypothetical protein
MATLLRVVATIGIAVGGMLLIVRFAGAQNAQRDAQSAQRMAESDSDAIPGYAQVELKARAAYGNEPQAVRAFTDKIFEHSTLADAARSIKDRVYRNELAFRNGQRGWASADNLVDAVNENVRRFNLPGHTRLTKRQLHMVREDLRFYVRHFAFGDPLRGNVPEDLSPAETVFVGLDLALQKQLNPEYQVEPEEWERRAAERRSRAKSARPLDTGQQPVKVSVKLVRITKPMLSLPDFSDESSIAVYEMHLFLDRLGFER